MNDLCLVCQRSFETNLAHSSRAYQSSPLGLSSMWLTPAIPAKGSHGRKTANLCNGFLPQRKRNVKNLL